MKTKADIGLKPCKHLNINKTHIFWCKTNVNHSFAVDHFRKNEAFFYHPESTAFGRQQPDHIHAFGFLIYFNRTCALHNRYVAQKQNPYDILTPHLLSLTLAIRPMVVPIMPLIGTTVVRISGVIPTTGKQIF